MQGEVPDEEYLIDIGVADVKRPGSDLSIITYSKMVLESLKAADLLSEDGIETEVVDLRTIKPLDKEMVLETVKKTGKVMCVSEGCLTNGVAAELAAFIQEEAFDYLDAPIRRVCSADVPVPMSPALESAMIPDADKIAAAARDLYNE